MRCAPVLPWSIRWATTTSSARTPAYRPMAIGIGLNTGSLMLGTIGESHRMDGTVISDAVNLAARDRKPDQDLWCLHPDLAEHL